MSAAKIRPNDVAAALAYFRHAVESGTLRPGEASSLAMLQDDPTELRAGMTEASKDPAFAAQLKSLQTLAPPVIKRR